MRDNAIDSTRRWVEDIILGLNLCPFAATPFQDESIRYALSRAHDAYELLAEVLDLCSQLDESSEITTTLLIIPQMLADWDAYLDCFAAAEELLERTEIADRYQIVSFHPEYCFAGTPPNDPANRTNRSPHPTIHILRRADVAQAIASHPDTTAIPIRNQTLLRSLSAAQLAQLEPTQKPPIKD